MTLKLSADDAKLSAQFKALKTPRDVATLLEVTPRALGFYLHRKNNYKVFQLRKRNGGMRVISSPVTPLKIIQRKLNQVLHAVYVGRALVHGFARGKNIVTNASRHIDRGLILNFDLEDFFPSIHFGISEGTIRRTLRRQQFWIIPGFQRVNDRSSSSNCKFALGLGGLSAPESSAHKMTETVYSEGRNANRDHRTVLV